MINADQVADSQFAGWLKKHRRSLIAGSIAFLFSGWILHGTMMHSNSRALEWVLDRLPILSLIVAAPFKFYPPSWFQVFFGATVWGVMATLVASSTKNQRWVGFIVFLLLIAIGICAFLLIAITVPTRSEKSLIGGAYNSATIHSPF